MCPWLSQSSQNSSVSALLFSTSHPKMSCPGRSHISHTPSFPTSTLPLAIFLSCRANCCRSRSTSCSSSSSRYIYPFVGIVTHLTANSRTYLGLNQCFQLTYFLVQLSEGQYHIEHLLRVFIHHGWSVYSSSPRQQAVSAIALVPSASSVSLHKQFIETCSNTPPVFPFAP